jgi:hypothetical protein
MGFERPEATGNAISKTLFFHLPGSVEEVADRVGHALCVKWSPRGGSADEDDRGWIVAGAGMKIRLHLNAGKEHQPAFSDCTYAMTLQTAYADVDGLPDPAQISEWIGLGSASDLAQGLGVPVQYESRLGTEAERRVVTHNPEWLKWKSQGPKAFLQRTAQHQSS